MIQFNLLPSVKLEYVRASRNKRMTFLISGLVALVALAVLIILFVSVQIFQKNFSADLSKDIKDQSHKLTNTADLNKVLTIQNQLASLTSLHDQKPVATRLAGYIKQITPANVSIAKLDIDFDTKTINITGAADSIATINKFADTLKFTQYKTSPVDKTIKGKTGDAFPSVVLNSFGRDDKGASYIVKIIYDPVIFSNVDPVELLVPPGKITSRSETQKPDPLFQPLSDKKGTGQ